MEGEELLHQGKWLDFKAQHATNRSSAVRWEFVSRRNQTPESSSVSILAITTSTDQVLLIANFRYPVNKFVIEMPAGLVDPGEDPLQAALREVKEETGYTVRPEDVIGQSPLVSPCPWLISESTILFTVRVDDSLPENQTLHQDLDEVENIRVIMLPKKSLLSSLLSYADQEGYGIDSRLYVLAQGLELSSAFS